MYLKPATELLPAKTQISSRNCLPQPCTSVAHYRFPYTAYGIVEHTRTNWMNLHQESFHRFLRKEVSHTAEWGWTSPTLAALMEIPITSPPLRLLLRTRSVFFTHLSSWTALSLNSLQEFFLMVSSHLLFLFSNYEHSKLIIQDLLIMLILLSISKFSQWFSSSSIISFVHILNHEISYS